MSRQGGFTLVEIAIVIVILGLLLGSVLKAQELITSARVRTLISQQDGIRAAFLGFTDRYRALPGDYSQATTNIAGVVGCGGNGDGDGRIEDATATPASMESVLVWEHLSKSGFINGTYTCNSVESNLTTPVNLYLSRLQLAWDSQYAPGSPPPAARHNLKTGGQISSDLLGEIDRKVDDGSATGGTFRFSPYAGGVPVAPDPAKCYQAAAPNEWSSSAEANCGATTLF
ncbi:MAG TPA: prepilin-type N-terminal cleavage/methylation domain-containing protein [Burkholderiales bacterium]|nr:prepilin-type N-terminal cleavage/methylation domain-containing protein [Burkholderiales bacterium]